MEELVTYRSDNGTFIFETKEECEKYDDFGEVDLKDTLIKAGNENNNIIYKLLGTETDIKSNDIITYIQGFRTINCNGIQSNNEELWKIVFSHKKQRIFYYQKQSTYEFCSFEGDWNMPNPSGWCPFWINMGEMELFAPRIPDYINETLFIENIKDTLLNFYNSRTTKKF